MSTLYSTTKSVFLSFHFWRWHLFYVLYLCDSFRISRARAFGSFESIVNRRGQRQTSDVRIWIFFWAIRLTRKAKKHCIRSSPFRELDIFPARVAELWCGRRHHGAEPLLSDLSASSPPLLLRICCKNGNSISLSHISEWDWSAGTKLQGGAYYNRCWRESGWKINWVRSCEAAENIKMTWTNPVYVATGDPVACGK